MSKSDPRSGPFVIFHVLHVKKPEIGNVPDALGMKGTEIGTRAGCALCHLLSPRVHTMMDMPFPRMSRPAQRMPPFARSVRREKKLWEQRTGAWELGAVKCLYGHVVL